VTVGLSGLCYFSVTGNTGSFLEQSKYSFHD
jgi:hypothetical protein